jgi:hypothetical protein
VLKSIKQLPMGDVDAAVILSRLPMYQDDDEVVLAAVQKFPKALDFASPRLRAKETVAKASAVADSRLQLMRSATKTNLKASSNVSSASTAASSVGTGSLGHDLNVSRDELTRHITQIRAEGVAEDWGSFREPV